MQYVQCVGQELGAKRPPFQLMVAWGPKRSASEIPGPLRFVVSAILPALENQVLVVTIERRQRGQKVKNILTDTTHLVVRQTSINSDVHVADYIV